MYALTLTAELNGVTNLRPKDTAENPFWYTFTVQCTSCRETHGNPVSVTPKPYEQGEPPKQQTIIEFDCRGLEFTSFTPEGEWLADGVESGTKFEGVDLQEGEWYEYDEKANDEFVPVNPRPMLQELVNKDIVVRLKWGETEYRGRLVSSDSYMNIQLTNAQEFIDQKFTSDLGQILIRCNNVLWIKAADQGENGDVKMGG
ncbi:hypothetical protein ABKA04_003158 [Annulohypoxylon sp. FPYF3050]